jgi:DNA polymerase-3 subunit gamma/tau
MTEPGSAYRVLARKYRPQRFAELIGQEAMVRTLSNAIATGRIAHAFILTGVRGVGKTSTARILARALNCVGPDGTGGPTVAPCGVCEPCRAIAEDRHVDVIETDAASHTGVDEMRELTEGVRYRPVAARYKVYIIDEVHMLSKSAFNALLKTLEEPPPDIIFIFATTEIQKVPVTVLSRCQRFSLRRVPIEQLVAHYQRIAAAENIAVAPMALALIARAADGSVRDGLSLLDQAIALSAGAAIDEAMVRDMLGIADRHLVFDLFEAVLKGDAADALNRLAALYEGGADPVLVLQDLLELAHFLTRLKLTPEAGENDPTLAGARERGLPLARQLGMPLLTRAWQMLLKGIGEAQVAPSPREAAEMVLVRLAYAADLPPPGDLVKALSEGREASPAPALASRGPGPGNGASAAIPAAVNRGAAAVSARALPLAEPVAPGLAPSPTSFRELLDLFERRREAILRAHLYAHVHLVHFERGRVELRLDPGAPRDLINKVAQKLVEWTGQRWLVGIAPDGGETTMKEQEEAREHSIRGEAARHPLVRAVLDAFPGARIETVREIEAPAPDEAEPLEPEDSEGEALT